MMAILSIFSSIFMLYRSISCQNFTVFHFYSAIQVEVIKSGKHSVKQFFDTVIQTDNSIPLPCGNKINTLSTGRNRSGPIQFNRRRRRITVTLWWIPRQGICIRIYPPSFLKDSGSICNG
ncbi:uncharacterized protein LOC117179491 [Belonocnema kinseyi]|uniref:uncharacterized protein LOC117179491 n=1 Tax=Belonocnema kinseyi TaxID=2817044 RepID=UPI00143DDB3D|nr:uncharacterized protein LOC117179491 [Belonocnema kinseyi]